MCDIGSFGALFRLDLRKYKKPVLVSEQRGWHKAENCISDREIRYRGNRFGCYVRERHTDAGSRTVIFSRLLCNRQAVCGKARDVVKGIAAGCRDQVARSSAAKLPRCRFL